MYTQLNGNPSAYTDRLILEGSPVNQINLPFIPPSSPVVNYGMNGLGDLETFASSFGGSATGFALIAVGLLIFQSFFGPGAKEERGKKKLKKLEADYQGRIAKTKAAYGLS